MILVLLGSLFFEASHDFNPIKTHSRRNVTSNNQRVRLSLCVCELQQRLLLKFKNTNESIARNTHTHTSLGCESRSLACWILGAAELKLK